MAWTAVMRSMFCPYNDILMNYEDTVVCMHHLC